MAALHTYSERNQTIQAALLSEAYTLIAPLKLRVADYYLQNSVMPHNNSDAGLSAPDTIFGTSVKRIAVNRGGVIRVDFDEEIGKADMLFTPTTSANSGYFSWRCTSDSLDPALLEKLRPSCSHLPSTQESKLMKAIANQDLDKLNRALNAGADVNAVVHGNTPLMLAARVGNSAALKVLIEKNADIDHLGVNADRRTPLMVAITSNRAEAATVLLSHGASVLRTDYQGKSALDHAKDTDSRLSGERYELMVTARLNPKFAGSQETNLEAVVAEMDLKQTRAMYGSLRSFAQDCNTQRLQSVLIREDELPADGLVLGKPIESHKVKPACSADLMAFVESKSVYKRALDARLSNALLACDALTVRTMLRDNPSVDVLEATGKKHSYFELAVQSGCADIASEVIREYSLEGALDPVLLVSAIQGEAHDSSLRLVGSLIEAGVDVNAKSPTGETALSAAIAADQPVIAKYLIDAGADVNLRSESESFPIIEASKKGYQHLVSQLISAGADIDVADSMGRTAIFAAVAQGKSRLVETLLRAGANPHKRDDHGISARILAESSGQRMIQSLITATASNLQ